MHTHTSPFTHSCIRPCRCYFAKLQRPESTGCANTMESAPLSMPRNGLRLSGPKGTKTRLLMFFASATFRRIPNCQSVFIHDDVSQSIHKIMCDTPLMAFRTHPQKSSINIKGFSMTSLNKNKNPHRYNPCNLCFQI